MKEKIILNLKTVFEYPDKVLEVRKNETILTLDPDSGFLDYDTKIDYDQIVEIKEVNGEETEDKGEVNITYKKYESGIFHVSEVIGIWKKSESRYKYNEGEIKEEYDHILEISTKGIQLAFSIDLKEMKQSYNKLIEFYKEYKTK